jgi:uncharacterized protein (DUF2147 family)
MSTVKSIRSAIVIGLAGALQFGSVVQAMPQSIIEGVWLTQLKSEVSIVPCGAGYCGLLTKIVVPPEIIARYGDDLEAIGTNYTDYNNKDPALRSRPIQNLQILHVRPGNSPRVFDGEVYNPQDGNIYSGYVEVLGPDRIKLNGCVLYNLICIGEEWVRVYSPTPPAR